MLKLIVILALISFNFSNSQTNKIEKKNLLLIDSMINNEILENKIPEGKLIRKEITRREKCNYWKGEFRKHKGGLDGEVQTPSVVGTVRIVSGGASGR